MELDCEGHRLLSISTSDNVNQFDFSFQTCGPVYTPSGFLTTPLYYYDVKYRRAEVDVWLKDGQQKNKPFPREIYFMEGRGPKRATLGLTKIRYGLNSFLFTIPEECMAIATV